MNKEATEKQLDVTCKYLLESVFPGFKISTGESSVLAAIYRQGFTEPFATGFSGKRSARALLRKYADWFISDPKGHKIPDCIVCCEARKYSLSVANRKGLKVPKEKRLVSVLGEKMRMVIVVNNTSSTLGSYSDIKRAVGSVIDFCADRVEEELNK